MKVAVFSNIVGGAGRFLPFREKYEGQLEFVDMNCAPLKENFHKIKENACEGMIYFSSKKEDKEFYLALQEAGIRFIGTCSVGYDHFNLPVMKELGIRGANVPAYSPNAVAEHAMTLTMALLRHLPEQIARIDAHNYDTKGCMARELRNMTVGIIGLGRIGRITMQCIAGFGTKKIYANDIFENEDAKKIVTYTDLDTLYRECDVIIMHCNYTPDSYHMIDETAIAKMKDGVILVNCARAPLCDAKALANGLQSGKIGGVGLDVIEGEDEIIRAGKDADACPVPDLEKLLEFPNFIYTRHTAFFTDQAFRDLSGTTVDNMMQFAATGTCDNDLTAKADEK